MSKTSEKAYKTQYAKYLERFDTLRNQGKIKRLDVPGNVPAKPYSYNTFKTEMDRWVRQNPTDNKYTAGAKIALSNAQYTKNQYKAFYREVQDNLANIKASDEQTYNQIVQIMKDNYNQQGKWLVASFERNALDIMELYFAWSGSYEITS